MGLPLVSGQLPRQSIRDQGWGEESAGSGRGGCWEVLGRQRNPGPALGSELSPYPQKGRTAWKGWAIFPFLQPGRVQADLREERLPPAASAGPRSLIHSPAGKDRLAFTFFQIPVINDILAFRLDGFQQPAKRRRESDWTTRTPKWRNRSIGGDGWPLKEREGRRKGMSERRNKIQHSLLRV